MSAPTVWLKLGSELTFFLWMINIPSQRSGQSLSAKRIDNGLYCLIWLKLNKMLNYFFLERDFTYETLTNKIMCYDRSVVPIILGLTAKVSPAIMVHIYNCHAVFNKVVTRSTPLSLLLPYMFPYQQLKINGSSNWSVHVNSKHWLIYR